MTSGVRTLPLKFLAAAALVLAALPAWSLDLSELMALLAQRTSGEARFVEQRFVKGLDQPLQSSGTLSFTAPDRFARRTLEPRAESMVVQGNQVTLSRGGRSKTLTLDASPEALVAVEAMRGTLTGNAKALQKYFKTRVSGTAERWTLELTPLDNAAAGPLLGLKVSGSRDELRTVETQLQGGDASVMTIYPQRPGSAAAPAS
jgi:outer membrane lipoprotein-sorting protein